MSCTCIIEVNFYFISVLAHWDAEMVRSIIIQNMLGRGQKVNLNGEMKPGLPPTQVW